MAEIMIFGNSLIMWVVALVTLLGVFLILEAITKISGIRLKTDQKKGIKSNRNYILVFIHQTKTIFILLLSIFIASTWLVLSDNISLFIRTIFIIVFWIQAGIWGTQLLSYLVTQKNALDGDNSDITKMNALKTVLRVVLWSVIFLLVVDNIPGVEITALLTSLGIGGIAIGLAVQNILSDLFASLSISLDKPFAIGDFIQVDNYLGTVEKIGLKSTRLRSISGEQLVFSNSDLLNSRIQNFKRLEKRRVVINLGVLYQTPSKLLKEIPNIVKEIFSKMEGVSLERIHLSDFGDSSINFELVYWVESSEYYNHMEVKQKILLDIFDAFVTEGIDFAYPTQSIFLENYKPLDI